MAKYRVYVTGNLDWDFEIDAEDEQLASDEAECKFQDEFSSVMWSGVSTFDVEKINEESDSPAAAG